MFINCPNRCSDAELEEYREVTQVRPLVNFSNDKFIYVDSEAVVISPKHDKTYYVCNQCGHHFGNLNKDEILKLMGIKQ